MEPENEQGTQSEKREGDPRSDSNNDVAAEIPAETELDFLVGKQASLLILAVSMAGFLYALDVNIIVTAIPVITTHFHTIRDIGWYGSAYLITVCACTPMVGKILQFYNAKITFFIFVFIFEIGSLLCAVAPSSTALVIGRAVAGIGGSGLFSGGLTIIAMSLPKERRAQSVAFAYVFAMLGAVLGPILGGLLTEKASWRWCFYINLPPGAASLAIVSFIRVPDQRQKAEGSPKLSTIINRLDPVGFVLFASACVEALLALQLGGSSYAWNSSTIIGLFVGFGTTLIVFFLWENRRRDTAMVPLSMLRQRVVFSSCLVVMSQFGSLQAFAYYLPVWFQTIKGVDPILSGAFSMATAAPLTVGIIITGVLAKLGNPAIFALLGNGLAAIGGGLMSTFTLSTHTGVWVGYQIIAGFGRGMTLQQPVNAVQQNLPASLMSVGTSMVVFSQFFGSACGLALAETDFSSSLGSALPKYAPGVNVSLISQVGAVGVRGAVSSDQLPGVLEAYNEAVKNTFYLGTAFSISACLAAWGMGLKLRTKEKATAPIEA